MDSFGASQDQVEVCSHWPGRVPLGGEQWAVLPDVCWGLVCLCAGTQRCVGQVDPSPVGAETAMASSQTTYDGGLFSSQEPGGVLSGVVIPIVCPAVASGLVFEKRFCFLEGKLHFGLTLHAAILGKAVCPLVAWTSTVGWNPL